MDHTENISVKQENIVKQEGIFDGDGTPMPGTKRPRSFGNDPFSEVEVRQIRQKLDVGLSRSETMQRPGPGGCRLTYIEGWKVIHDANQIFGFNGWSSTIVSLDLRFIDSSNGRHTACVCATVRVTLRDGTSHEDRGGGIAENMRSKGEAFMKAEKEAVTDATKRALKNFGLRLGLSLYDRQHVREMNRPQPHPQPQQQAQAQNLEANRITHQQQQAHRQQQQREQQHQLQQVAAVAAATVAKSRNPSSTTGGSKTTNHVAGIPSSGAMGRAVAAHVAANCSNRDDAIQRQFAMNARQNGINHPPSNTNGMNLARIPSSNSGSGDASTAVAVSAAYVASGGMQNTSLELARNQGLVRGQRQTNIQPCVLGNNNNNNINNNNSNNGSATNSKNGAFQNHAMTTSGTSTFPGLSAGSNNIVGNFGSNDMLRNSRPNNSSHLSESTDAFDRSMRAHNMGLQTSRIPQHEIDELSAIGLADF